MFKNYLKIAWRSLLKNRVFSFINVFGLAIGLSASFVIGVIIFYDLTFDKFHPDSDRLYRVTSNFTSPKGASYNRGVAVPIAKYIKENISGVETVSAFFNTYLAKVENKKTEKVYRNVEDAIYADKNYFELFKYKWIAGSPQNTLSNPKEVVLTRLRAAKYFPNTPPQQLIGNTLAYNDSVLVNIVGVVENFEKRSDFNFQEFLSLKTATYSHMKDQVFGEHWNNTNSATQVFIKVAEKGKVANIQEQLDVVAEERANAQLLSFGMNRKFHLQPLNDIHFNADYGVFNNSNNQASKAVLTSLAFIALFLLLLGCINFINLNTAQATKRSKEIGIRKTLGSSKKQLVFQFLGETFLLTTTAAIVSLFLSAWLLQLFSDFIPQGIGFELFSSPVILVSIVILLLAVTLLSGFYPALILSHFKPISVLKNQGVQDQNKFPLRKYLTVFQFVIAQIFVIATILVGKQINFLTAKDMGFKTEANAFVRAWHDPDINKRHNFIEAIKTIPMVSEISLGGSPPASNNTNSSITTYIKDGEEMHTTLELLFGDMNYLNLYDIKLLAGRKRLNDTIKELVINETYSKILGFANPQDALGKSVKMSNDLIQIVGVMEDFNQRSLHTKIQPMAISGNNGQGRFSPFNTIHLSFAGENIKQWPDAIHQMETNWKAIYPEAAFDLNFMDQSVKQFYEQERKTSVLLKWATGLAICISCLGLFGLVIYTTERRIKEIGVRKVLGASLMQLNKLLCKEFLILVGIAFAIAAPIAWWGLHSWLQDFAYKTKLSWWVFLLSGIAMLLIALGIMSIKTIRAAMTNPVKSLRTE